VEVIRIEGVEFALEDAREFVERVLIYGQANQPMSPERSRAFALAMQIEVCLRDQGSLDVRLDEKVVASAVLDEWLQSGDAPEAARPLYRALAAS
jgi:hypothetical protein